MRARLVASRWLGMSLVSRGRQSKGEQKRVQRSRQRPGHSRGSGARDTQIRGSPGCWLPALGSRPRGLRAALAALVDQLAGPAGSARAWFSPSIGRIASPGGRGHRRGPGPRELGQAVTEADRKAEVVRRLKRRRRGACGSSGGSRSSSGPRADRVKAGGSWRGVGGWQAAVAAAARFWRPSGRPALFPRRPHGLNPVLSRSLMNDFRRNRQA